MASSSRFLLIILTLIAISHQTTCRILRLPSDEQTELYCNSWRLSVETNNAGAWSIDPQCYNYLYGYLWGGNQYLSDTEFVASDSLAFAKTVNITGDGLDAWVFDIDDTLLSNFFGYGPAAFGSELLHKSWKDQQELPAIEASLKLYNEVKALGFTIFCLTGRYEREREFTLQNLKSAGYSDWKRVILRAPEDEEKTAVVYKSQKRQELIDEGYRIHGNSGDQWSDLLGFAVAERSFKHPNPAYHIA